MKSTIAFALAATIPFAVASPYHMIQHAARDADANNMVYVTDVDVVAVTTQITVYYTGEPATVSTSAVASSTVAAVQQKQQHEEHRHSRQSSVVWTIQKTTTPEVAPTTTSTVAPPVAEPTTIITVVPTSWPASSPESTTEPTTSSAIAASTTTTAQGIFDAAVPSAVSISTPTGNYQAAVYGSQAVIPTFVSGSWVPYAPIPTNLATGPSDYYASPNDNGNYIRTGADSWKDGNWQVGVLARHNAWRAKWGATPLVWNDTVAATANNLAQKGTADNCMQGHDQNVGQNLAWGYNTYDGPYGMVDTWGSESANWQISHRDGSSPDTWQLDNEVWKVEGAGVGHFTQVVYKETTSVGCGLKECSENSWFLVCNYYPWGNFGDPATADWVDAEGRKGSTAANVDSVPQY